MNTELVNKLHGELQSLDLQIEDINDEWQRLEEKWSNVLADWVQKVIDIGQAIIESKAQYGKGWKRDYESLGFEFSYTVACRYASCAEQPDARGDVCSVEQWAKAAGVRSRATDEAAQVKEAKRKQRAETRRLMEAQSSDEFTDCEEQMPLANCSTENASTTMTMKISVDSPNLQNEMQASFDQLNNAILTDPRLKKLRPYWQQLLAGLSQGYLPRISMVSSYETDDTIEPGGSAMEFERQAEFLKA